MDLIRTVIEEVDRELEQRAKERREQDLPFMHTFEVRILGQMSLLMDRDARNLNPIATRDMDALLKGDIFAVNIFKDVLAKWQLIYDDLSNEVWLPSSALFLPYFASERLMVSYLDPISALTSKAIKAKEKNQVLVRRGLEYFGESLAKEIERYGGDLEYFKARGLEL